MIAIVEVNQGPQGPAGSDANVTNASVNAAIAENPVASQLAAEVYTPVVSRRTLDDSSRVYATGDSRKPWEVTSGTGTTASNGTYHTLTPTVAGVATTFRHYTGFDINASALVFEIQRDANFSSIQVTAKCGTQAATKTLTMPVYTDSNSSAYRHLPGRWYRLVIPLSDFNGRTAGTDSDDLANVWAVDITITPKAAVTTDFLIRKMEVVKGDGVPRVCFTFDDGRDDTYLTAFPILSANGFAGDVSVEYNTVGGANRCTLAQLQELYAAGWNIQGHDTQNMTSIGDAAGTIVYQGNRDLLTSNGFRRGSEVWVWPGGVHDEQREQTAERYFPIRRVVSPFGNYALPGITEKQLGCGHVYVTKNGAASLYKQYLDSAFRDKTTVVFVFHSILTTPSASEDYDIAKFTEIVEYAASLGMQDIRYADLHKDYPLRP